MFNNQRRTPGVGIYLLTYHILGIVGLDKIPPVTSVTVMFLIAIYLRSIALPWETIDGACISSQFVFENGEWERLVYGALEHGGDFHIYYNMVSFILKGQRLEKHFGAANFLYILLVFTPLTSLTYCTLIFFAGAMINDNFRRECGVGFSGVIFALKVLTSYLSPNCNYKIFDIVDVPLKYIFWFELLLYQILAPNVSFFGHLAGILVGLAYVRGPLKFIMQDMFVNAARYISFQGQNIGLRLRGGGMVRPRHSHSHTEYNNFPRRMREDEQIWRAAQASLLDNYMNSYGSTRMSSTNDENYLSHSTQQSNIDRRQRTYEESYPSDLSDEEQLPLATESSIRENFNYSRTDPSAPELDDNEFYYSGQLRPPTS